MKPVERKRGLYKNGSRWWMRVLGEPKSTGTSDLALANWIAGMVEELGAGNGVAREWLDRVAAGDVTLIELYNARAEGSLHDLKARLAVSAATDSDPDLEPIVGVWIASHLPLMDLADKTREDYARQVRSLIPEGKRFPASTFTEDTLKKALHGLTDVRSGAKLSGSTLRRATVAWKLFWKFARKRVPGGIPSPFDEPDWIPANGSPRRTWWDHDTTMKVLDKMTGEHRVAMLLVFATGMEESALLNMQGRHVLTDRMVVAPGTKNEHREDRTIFVDAWAWEEVHAHAATKKPHEPLFTSLGQKAKMLRRSFYDAQIAAGLIECPPLSKVTKLPLWGLAEGIHNIHDARHTFCIVRLLGLDGEPRQSLKYCSMQLGHADEQMVMRIYTKANIDQRLRMIELAEAKRRAA